MTEGSGETRLSDQIAYHRSLCDAATPGPWRSEMSPWYIVSDSARKDVCTDQNMDPENRAFVAAHSPDVVSALLDVVEAAQEVAEISDYMLPSSVDDLRDALAALSQRMGREAP